MIDLEHLLHFHGLRNTKFRKNLLSMFYEVNSSLTVDEIRNKIGNKKDKVTIYRALEAFENSGLIHIVPDKNNLIRYAICNEKCYKENHYHNHAHFICDNCHETYCIEEIEIPKINNKIGFKIKESSLTLNGECAYCAK